MGNYKDALTDVKHMVDYKFPNLPKHQGVIDITEVIEFANIAESWGLSSKQYEALVKAGEKYYQKLSKG